MIAPIIVGDPATTQPYTLMQFVLPNGTQAAIFKHNASELQMWAPSQAQYTLAIDASGAVRIAQSGGKVGFYGATTRSKQSVTGSRASNVALASLLTMLGNLGLITDSTTA